MAHPLVPYWGNQKVCSMAALSVRLLVHPMEWQTVRYWVAQLGHYSERMKVRKTVLRKVLPKVIQLEQNSASRLAC
mgnify:CR=1 FL=1